MEKLDGCIAAHVCPKEGLTLLFSKETEVTEESLTTLLKSYKVRISEFKKLEQAPY